VERKTEKPPGDDQDGLILETPRLRLRPFVPQDLPSLHAFFVHPDVRRYLWDNRVIGHEEVEALIAASLSSFSALGLGQWLAEDREKRGLVGFCGLRVVNQAAEVEILYALVRERWGEGLATEAGNAVLRHAFLRVGLPRVMGRTDSPNLASARVLERLGMRFEGERTSHGLPILEYAISGAAFRERAAMLGS
jgi:RimJ/RimL family protein N-acetyltransferase